MRIRVALAAGLLLAATSVPDAAQGAAYAAPRCDITADGTADLVTGVPNADGNRATETDSGAVVVIPGGASGPDARGSWKITQDVAGVPDRNERGDAFGSAVSCADLDGDGYGDVVVGVPGETVAGRANAGAVHVFYGSSLGLVPDRNQRWTPRKPGVAGDAVADARFGAAMAVGDFDGDGHGDVAIASPGIETIHVLYGSARGVTARDTVITEGTFDLAAAGFGTSLTAGDLDGDGRDDLVVGAPDAAPAGAVAIIWGSAGTIDAADSRVVHFDSSGIRGSAKPGAALGAALAAADYDGDGRDDLAMGAPGYRYAGNDEAGVVLVLFGSRSRVGSRDRLVSSTAPVAGAGFGSALAAGDFNGDDLADFAAGAPTDDGAAPYAGRVEIRLGSSNATFVDGEVLLGPTLGAGFGSELTATDVDADGADDLWVAAPRADVAGVANAGALFYVPGSSSGSDAVRRIDRTTRGIAGGASPDEAFGVVDASAHVVPHPALFLEVADRSTWSRRTPVTSRMDPHAITEITIHHLGGSTSRTGVTRYRIAQDWHMDGLGWGDIAYHYIVGEDGRVYAARDHQWAGDTSTDYDPNGHLLIVAAGNFDKERPTEPQLAALAATVAWAVDEFEVPVEAVTGHKDHAATACPGEHLYPYVASGDLADDVRELLDAGGVWMVPAGTG